MPGARRGSSDDPAGTSKPAAAAKANGAAAVAHPPVTAQTKVSELKGSAATLASYMDQSTSIPTATVVSHARCRAAPHSERRHQRRRPRAEHRSRTSSRMRFQAVKHSPACACCSAATAEPQRVEAGINLVSAVDSVPKTGRVRSSCR